MKQIFTISSFNKLLLFGVLLTSFLITVNTPFTGDVLASFGAAFQADYLGNFPYNVYESWHMRGIGYKYMVFILYKSLFFIDSSSHGVFPIAVRILYYLVFMSLSYGFIYLIRRPLARFNLDYNRIFFLFTISILTTSHWINLQAEEIAVLFTLGMTSFALTENKYLNYLSGSFILILLSLKVITILYAGFPFLIAFAYYKFDPEKTHRLIISSFLFTIITVLFYLLIIPREITDTVHATQFQNSFQLSLTTPMLFFSNFIRAFAHIPILLVGTMIAIFIGIKNMLKNKKFVLLILISLIIPTVAVIFQHKWFSYHYAIFIPSTLIFIFASFNLIFKPENESKYNIIIYICFILHLVFAFKSTGLEYQPFKDDFARYRRGETHYLWQKNVGLSINREIGLDRKEEVLFLTSGPINYFCRQKSYLRYFYPLPIQRAKSYSNLMNQDIFKNTLTKIIEYKGDFIIRDPNWFNLEKFNSIKIKLDTEYILINEYMNEEIGTYLLYKRKM